MTRPGLDDATRIRQACRTIETCWPEMLPDAPKATLAGTIGRTQSDPLPIPVHILDTRAEALVRLAGWAMVVADDMDLHTSLDGTDAPGLARFVAIHADYLATLGSEPVDELGDSARKCDRIVDRPGALEFVGRCEVCQGDLRTRDRKTALCRDCGTVVDAETTREQLLRVAEDRLMTAAEIVMLAPRMWDEPVTHVRLHRWVKSGRLISHGLSDERPTYRVGDVAVLAAQIPARRGA